MNFLKGKIDEVLQLEADDTETSCWYVYATFAVHKDMKSHKLSTEFPQFN